MRYKEARNYKKRLVKGTLTQAHRRRVQQVIEEGPHGMWRLAKWARNRDGAYERGITPSLKQLDGTVAETVDEKASAFQAAFFPQPPPADLSDTTNFNYPDSPLSFCFSFVIIIFILWWSRASGSNRALHDNYFGLWESFSRLSGRPDSTPA
ncbi:hypothetical protein PENDEC_c006G04633 [Penicillium decumbens]|uniref:Uncharacterized protein n=1 Tax=Penicillium decumbens TaxID=69771 RepID=A0A1V6PF60_PENDC|nr:hypothetical protein PENDEC_c006G04633 [Penicillium decumbens]